MQEVGYRCGVEQTETWTTYLASIRGDDLDKDVAQKAGVSASTLSRWLSGLQFPSPQQVIALARSYRESPLDALVAAGHLTASELSAYGTPRSLAIRDFSDVELAREILRRIEAGEATETLTEPMDVEDSNVTPFPGGPNVPTPVDTIDHVDAPDFEALDYAAKRGTRKADAEPWAE